MIYSILSKNYDMNHLGQMPFEFGVKAIVQALEKDDEKKAWEMWVVKLPHMTKENFINFTDFYAKLTTKVSKRSREDIIAEAISIQEELLKKKGGNANGNI